jgi:Gamma-glutamylcysteine synthetase
MAENIGNDTVKELLYQRYIAPTKRKRDQYVGVEIEMPVLNLNKEAVNFSVIHDLTETFKKHFKFDVAGKDDEGNVYALSDSITKDIFTYDCSYNNLELAFGKEDNIFEIWGRFKKYYSFIQKELSRHNYTLTGMGINPYRRYNNNVPIPNGRYRMLYHHLFSYKDYKLPMYFHDYPQFGTYASASQVQLDINYVDIVKTIRAFTRLEPIKAVLFSNSVLLGENEELLCARDMLWENGMQGFNPHNIGMYGCEIETVDDLLEYITTTSIYCTEQEGKYINFRPMGIIEYMTASEIEGEYFEDGDYHPIKIKPNINDIQYLRTFKFIDLTYRGTFEYRSACCQPISDAMCVAVFNLGLSYCVDELDGLLEKDTVIYRHGYSSLELRKLLLMKHLPAFVDRAKLKVLLNEILDIAAKGLRQRGKGEEVFLDCLYERADKLESPALNLLKQKNNSELEELIRYYAAL